MNQVTYERWWSLHLQVARGQTLSVEDQAFYDSARQSLEGLENLGDIEAARQERAHLTALQVEYAAWEKRRQQLNAEIAKLESALSGQARQLLQIEAMRGQLGWRKQ
jgi:hypothetical protein